MRILWIAVFLVSLVEVANGQSGMVEIWIRSFIPNPENAARAKEYIVNRPGSEPGSIIKLAADHPKSLQETFLTDHRGFSVAKGSTARLETRFSFGLDRDGKAVASPASNRTVAGITKKVDGATGKVIAEGAGSVDRDHLGVPSTADGVVQIAGQVQGRNMLTPLSGSSPSIDYTFDLTWDPRSSRLTGKVSLGSFPAHEVYARRPGGVWVSVLRRLPTGTPWALMADGFGINMSREDISITVPAFAGVWRSDDPKNRFSLSAKDGEVHWVEFDSNGGQVACDVPITASSSGSFRIERPNDDAVLKFLGFQPSLRAEILAARPEPSYMEITPAEDTLRAEWHGLLAIKNAKAQLEKLKQPSESEGKIFVMRRVTEAAAPGTRPK